MKSCFNIIIYSAIILLSTSCGKYINKTPEDNYQVTANNYLLSQSDYQTMAVSVYTPLEWLNQETVIGDVASDNSVSGGESASDVLDLQQIDNYTTTSTNGTLANLWQYAYEGINRANYLTEYDSTNPAGHVIAFAGKDAMYGEVYFLRAYYYFQLVKLFGDVPLFTDKQLDISATGTIPRSPKAAVYLSIENDLKNAASILPATQVEAGRATKYAAEALLGKVYLYQQKYDSAAIVLQDVINSGQYSLVQNFASIFLLSGQNGPESVFEIQYSSNGANSYDGADPAQGPGNYAAQQCGVRLLSATSSAMPYAPGWSTNLPTVNLEDAYTAGDQREAATCLNIAAYAAANPIWGITYLIAPYKNTGLYNQKYQPYIGQNATSGGDPGLNWPNNYRTIRYADVLLMAAEAYNQGTVQHNDVTAQTYLNLVRKRAFQDQNHNIMATGSQLYAAILNERRLEFAMEGERFFDLVRTGQAAANIKGFVVGKNEVFPIPQHEVLVSGLKQNPGY